MFCMNSVGMPEIGTKPEAPDCEALILLKMPAMVGSIGAGVPRSARHVQHIHRPLDAIGAKIGKVALLRGRSQDALLKC